MVQTFGTEWHNTDKRQYKFNDSNNSKHNNRPKKNTQWKLYRQQLKLVKLNCNSDLLCCNTIAVVK